MTSDTLVHLRGVPVLACAPDGPTISGGADVVDVIGQALSDNVELVLLPVQRLAEEFFTLRTGVAGEIVQKFVNYRLPLVIVGDISGRVARSESLRAFVSESNRGRQLWFAATEEEVADRLR